MQVKPALGCSNPRLRPADAAGPSRAARRRGARSGADPTEAPDLLRTCAPTKRARGPSAASQLPASGLGAARSPSDLRLHEAPGVTAGDDGEPGSCRPASRGLYQDGEGHLGHVGGVGAREPVVERYGEHQALVLLQQGFYAPVLPSRQEEISSRSVPPRDRDQPNVPTRWLTGSPSSIDPPERTRKRPRTAVAPRPVSPRLVPVPTAECFARRLTAHWRGIRELSFRGMRGFSRLSNSSLTPILQHGVRGARPGSGRGCAVNGV